MKIIISRKRFIFLFVIMPLIFLIQVFTCLVCAKTIDEEQVFIEEIQTSSSELAAIELSNLRLEKARQFFKNWEIKSDKKDLKEALAYANSAIEINPDNASAYKLMAAIALQAPDDDKALLLAEDSLKKAIEINKKDALSRIELARVYMLQGRFYEASSLYENIFNTSKKSIIAANTTKLAECYIADKRIKWGIIYFNKLNQKKPYDAGVLIPMAVLYKHDNQKAKAEKILSVVKNSSKYSKTDKQYAKYLLTLWKENKV